MFSQTKGRIGYFPFGLFSMPRQETMHFRGVSLIVTIGIRDAIVTPSDQSLNDTRLRAGWMVRIGIIPLRSADINGLTPPAHHKYEYGPLQGGFFTVPERSSGDPNGNRPYRQP